MYICISSVLTWKSVLVAVRINWSKYTSSSSLTWFFSLHLVSVVILSLHNIQTPIQPCIWSLYTSDEWREFLIFLDQTLDVCFVQLYMWVHHIGQVKLGSLTLHCPCFYMINCGKYICKNSCYIDEEPLMTISMENFLVNSDKPVIQSPRDCFKRWYFNKYGHLHLCSSGSYWLFLSLPGCLKLLIHALVFYYEKLNTQARGFGISLRSIDQGSWMSLYVWHNHLFFQAYR